MRITRLLGTLLALAILAGVGATPASAQVRIKDIASFEGVRDNLLVGYGLVVGLNGSGDNLQNSPFTEQSIIGMLERLGVNIRGENFKPKNVAAVMVTATLPAFSRHGTRIDVTVSTIGDAKSLQGGTLLVTPLMGADGQVYAVSQGPVAIAGFSAEGDAASVTKGTPTNGRIAGGAITEREIPFALADMQQVRIALRNPDFTTASRMAEVINARLGGPAALATDPATVTLQVPPDYGTDVARLITDVEQLRLVPDQVSRVVIDERTGTIVMGDNVRISTVAISQGNLTVRITETPQVSQPEPFAEEGDTVVVPRTDVNVIEGGTGNIAIVGGGASLQDLVQGLNALGVGPRDMIAILQAIKAAGALQAEIEVM
ncbi:MAG: flagellar basal body P-ring protein FlgI [Dongiaceae bacterium]